MRILERLHQYLDKLDIRTILRRTSSRGEENEQAVPEKKKRSATPMTADQLTNLENTLLQMDGKTIDEVARLLSITSTQVSSHLYKIDTYSIGISAGRVWIKNQQRYLEKIAQMQSERKDQSQNAYTDLTSGLVSKEEEIRRLLKDHSEE